MISQLNQNRLFLFHPALHQKPVIPQSPFYVSLKVENSRGFKATHVYVPRFSAPVSSIQSRSAKRVSRVARNEAQDVLMDYLHLTRRYRFMDAEYISKNSPRFIEGLFSKINVQDDDDDDDEDVGRALRKFLRYNPINEFEPFFESVGISPSELHLVLPSDMIFLDDEYMLLDNFHALSVYGIPRNRMGKIYKEAKEIFGYGSGLLLSKLKAYENLGLSTWMVIKLVVCCPSLLVGHGINSEFVSVLDWLKGIGIEIDWIVNRISSSRTYNMKRMLDTIQCLHEVGYSEEQMHNLFKENPKLLLEGFGKKLYLFLDRSRKLGIKMNVICSYFIEYPHMLSYKCAKNLLRVIDFLCFIGMGTDDIVHILSNYMHLLSIHSLKGPKTVCRELKIKKADLYQIIKDDPLKLISMASKSELKSSEQISCHDPPNHVEKTTFLLKLGYTENSEEMAKAFKKFRGRGDQLQERFDCLVEAGLDYNSVVEMVKRVPMILNLKKVVIEKKIDLLRNILGYPLECVVGFPSYFCYNMEKIIKRFSMYAWLKERNAINPSFTLSNIVSANEKRFVKYFVNAHPQGPTVWENLKRLSNEDKN